MSVEFTSDAKKFCGRFDTLNEKARYLLSSQILADANKHAKEDTGTLKSSSLESSVLKDGLLIWNTVYAKRAYYTGVPSTDKNPDAELRWVEVARDRYGKDWIAIFTNLARKEILK